MLFRTNGIITSGIKSWMGIDFTITNQPCLFWTSPQQKPEWLNQTTVWIFFFFIWAREFITKLWRIQMFRHLSRRGFYPVHLCFRQASPSHTWPPSEADKTRVSVLCLASKSVLPSIFQMIYEVNCLSDITGTIKLQWPPPVWSCGFSDNEGSYNLRPSLMKSIFKTAFSAAGSM